MPKPWRRPFFPAPRGAAEPERRYVRLPDGDQLVLHDDCPAAWRPGGRTIMLVHGLCGCHASAYMRRISHKFTQRGVRTFRLDLRGGGAGALLARKAYHSGCTDDVVAALEHIAEVCGDSPTTLIGFSLGGNVTLKLLGDVGSRRPGNLDSAVAVCPPIDLMTCSANLQRGLNRLYDRRFASLLYRRLRRRARRSADVIAGEFDRKPRTMWEFDAGFTAPVWGYGRVENYYNQASSGPVIPNIRWPTLIIAADDDPLIPAAQFAGLQLPESVRLHMAAGGGHLGFIGAGGVDPDRRWLDWRLVEWVAGRG